MIYVVLFPLRSRMEIYADRFLLAPHGVHFMVGTSCVAFLPRGHFNSVRDRDGRKLIDSELNGY